MDSLILRTGAVLLLPLLLLFSIFLLLRGHNEPGGGFAGGLMAAAALALYAVAYDSPSARRVLRWAPHTLVGVGLLVALASGLLALAKFEPLMKGLWLPEFVVPGIGELHLGTPLMFDVGVYLVVLGMTTMVVLTLLEE